MSKIRRQADRRKESKWEMHAGSDRLQRWQASSKIRRQADRRKASKYEMYAESDRLQRWQASSKIRRQADRRNASMGREIMQLGTGCRGGRQAGRQTGARQASGKCLQLGAGCIG
jgi:hypothetical protein